MASLLDRAKEWLFSRFLLWASREGALKRHLDSQRIKPSGNLDRVDRRRIRVAAVQMRLELLGRPQDYADRVLALAREAVDRGAQLVALPEDAATHLLGLLPGVSALTRAGSVDSALAKMGPGLKVADIFRFLGPAMRRIYTFTFSYLARAFGVYLAAGSAVLPEPDGRVYNTAHLFGPTGQLVGMQRKLHLLPMEQDWGLHPGSKIEVFDTAVGRLGLPVCMDATYFETFRILSLLGTEVAVLPTANPESYNLWKSLRGVWPRVQESRVYGLHSCMVGEFFGLKLTGRAGVFAPLPLAPGGLGSGDGVLAQVEDPAGEGVAVADLDLEALAEHRARWLEGAGWNPEFYRRHLLGAYAAYRERCPEGRSRLGAAGRAAPGHAGPPPPPPRPRPRRPVDG